MLTENTQPAILATSIAALRLLESRGIRPGIVAGHSLGEYSAHVAAGTFDFADAVRIVRRRGRYMQEAVPVGEGAMAAILGGDAAAVAQACEEAAEGQVVSPANLNAPGQVVIAGHTAGRGAGRRASQGARGTQGRDAARQRAVPLRPDETGGRASRAGASGAGRSAIRGCRSSRTWTREPKTAASPAIEALVAQVSAPVRWEAVVGRLRRPASARMLKWVQERS